MIVEVADFRVEAGRRAAFEAAMAEGVKNVLSKSRGYRSHRILSCHENPERVLLTIEWDTLEDHTVGFRESPAFAEWRAIIGPFFKGPPLVEHFVVTDAA